MSEASELLVERNGHILTVTLNRPEAKNAFGLEMLARMYDAWKRINEDPEVRVAIVTGAGGDFCAGADLKRMHANQSDNPWHARFREDSDLHWKGLLRHYKVQKPLVAAVEGVAVGGGTEILLSTDIRVAAKSAVFGLTEPAWGLFPLGGSTVRLPRQLPYAFAMEMLLTGRRFSADEAKEMGLVNRVVADGQALTAAMEVAEAIAANGPLAVQAIKRSATEGLLLSERDALAHELEVGGPVVFQSEDAKEGTRAFKEKRRPAFRGL